MISQDLAKCALKSHLKITETMQTELLLSQLFFSETISKCTTYNVLDGQKDASRRKGLTSAVNVNEEPYSKCPCELLARIRWRRSSSWKWVWEGTDTLGYTRWSNWMFWVLLSPNWMRKWSVCTMSSFPWLFPPAFVCCKRMHVYEFTPNRAGSVFLPWDLWTPRTKRKMAF